MVVLTDALRHDHPLDRRRRLSGPRVARWRCARASTGRRRRKGTNAHRHRAGRTRRRRWCTPTSTSCTPTSFLTCSAAPIFDPRGNMLGVLDVTGDHRALPPAHDGAGAHVGAHDREPLAGRRLSPRRCGCTSTAAPEFIGTLMEGIVAVARDGRIVGANRSALDQLGAQRRGGAHAQRDQPVRHHRRRAGRPLPLAAGRAAAAGAARRRARCMHGALQLAGRPTASAASTTQSAAHAPSAA